MKKNPLLHLAYMATVAIIVTGCGGSVEYYTNDPVIVETVEAEANFDLTSRSDWNLTVESTEYQATINGNKVTGIPVEYPHYAYYGGMDVFVYLHHPGLSTEALRAEQIVPIKSQNTKEKLWMYDILEADCIATENITGAKLKHWGTLLEFTISGLPDDAELFLTERNNTIVWPYRNEEKPDMYQAILNPANNHQSIALVIRTADGVYGQVIDTTKSTIVESRMYLNTERNLLKGVMFTFNAKVEAIEEGEDKKLTISIEDLIANTSGNWPVTQ